FYDQGHITAGDLKALLLLLSPVAPHICEEIWEAQGCGGYIHRQPWPEYDENFLAADLVEIAVQLNGKVRARLMVPSDMAKEAGEEELPRLPEVQALIGDKQLVKCVFVPGRLLNLVIK
ncbi:MAG: class I tRNA ligase family protein, partial [Eubacteriales bacterium]|nr:class I tRNA ligase family protein [Eubacteriales bacterium]